MKSRNLFAAVLVACVLLCASSSALASGWFVKVDGNYSSHSQCNVVVDSVGVQGACTHRVSVMCLSNGVGSAAGIGSYNAPVSLPVTLPMRSSPYGLPVGSVTIAAVPPGANATIGLNGAAPTSDWVRAASYAGSSCTTSSTVKPGR